MNHPYELLADLVDGTLDPDARARVDAHLEGCSSCRDDVAAAAVGRREARSLPQASPPADLHRRVVGGAVPAAGGAPRWYRWGGVAAAAAIVAAIAIVLPNVGRDDGQQPATEAAGAGIDAPDTGVAEALAGDQVALEVQDHDYDARQLEGLARHPNATTNSADAFQARSSAAVRCVQRAFADEPPSGRLTRLIQARFEGRAAYIAVYLEGPGAGQPPDARTVWVATRDDCSILSVAQARL